MTTSATQTSVAAAPAIGRPGEEYDCAFTDVVSKVGNVAIAFGQYVVFKTENTCDIPASAADVTNFPGGVALIDPVLPTGTGYAANQPVRVMRSGRCFVLNDITVALNDPVFVRYTVNGGSNPGSFRNDADTSKAATPLNCHFFKGGTAGTAVLELNNS